MSRDANRHAVPVALVLALAATTAVEVDAQNAADQAAAVAAAPEAVPTYYGAVQSALQRNCVACHSETRASLGGMTAPFGLTTYDDARRYARSIARAVSGDKSRAHCKWERRPCASGRWSRQGSGVAGPHSPRPASRASRSASRSRSWRRTSGGKLTACA